MLQLLPAPGHPPAHVPVWDTLVRTGEVGMGAKVFTVYVGVVAAGVAEVMYTSHYTSRTLDIIITILGALSVLFHYTFSISPTLTVLCRHAALISFSPEVHCCVAALTIIAIGALVPTSIIILTTILTSVSVLDHC